MATQQAALAQAEATLPPLQKALAQQRNLLATLTGRLPSDRVVERFELTDLKLPQDLPLSLPSKLVEQRPDIRAAEANLHSAGAGRRRHRQPVPADHAQRRLRQRGAQHRLAVRARPRTASTIGVSILQTVLDGGALAAKKRAAQAALEQADAQYRSTVLTAFRNVADTLRALEYDAIAQAATSAAERARRPASTIARRRLELGDVGYLIVLNAELTYQAALVSLVQAQANRFTDTAALFQALGGGWWNRDAPAIDPKTGAPRCRPPTPQDLRLARDRCKRRK